MVSKRLRIVLWIFLFFRVIVLLCRAGSFNDSTFRFAWSAFGRSVYSRPFPFFDWTFGVRPFLRRIWSLGEPFAAPVRPLHRHCVEVPSRSVHCGQRNPHLRGNLAEWRHSRSRKL